MHFVTHDGVFHADDCFAGAALSLAFPGCEIVRSRKPEVLDTAELAFDVGGGAYDHHQPGGNGQRPNGMPYASFGLVWRLHGTAAVASIWGVTFPPDFAEHTAIYDEIARRVDVLLVQPIDAADNGESLHDGASLFAGVHGVSPATIIGWLNPQHADATVSDFDTAYNNAVGLSMSILCAAIRSAGERMVADNELKAALGNSAGGSLMVLPHYIAGWQDEAGNEPDNLLFCVYPSAGTWRVQTVPTAPGDRESRRLLPEKWAGLNGPELAALTGVADATFAHRGRFIAGATSRDGALALAALATK